MNLQFAHEIASRLLALSGVLAVFLTREVAWPIPALAIVAIALSTLLVLSGRQWLLRRQVWDLFSLIALGYFLLDLFFLSRSLLIASTHFVLFLMVNKVFNLRRTQDYPQLYLLSLLQLLAASTFTIDPIFGVSMLVYLFTAVWTLMLHHLVSEHRDRLRDTVITQRVSRPFFFTTNAVGLVAFVLTVVLFLLLPRLGIGFFQRSKTETIRTVGFSNQINLGDFGSVLQDDTIVMRAKVRGLVDRSKLYWRGGAFDAYDGISWKSTAAAGKAVVRANTGEFQIRPAASRVPLIEQEIQLEPLDVDILFGAPRPVAIWGRFPSLRLNEMGVISLPSTPAGRMSYTVRSQAPLLFPSDIGATAISVPPKIAETYLALPSLSPRIRDLALRVTDGAGTVLERVNAVALHLKSEYRYSLEVQPPKSGSILEDFLFDQKTGYCEHFATAMTVMLRTLGIPARMVSGFSPGEWNAYGDYFLVRQRDAHTWVEVWFPESGWIPFDPTPLVSEPVAAPIVATVTQFLDTLRYQWNRYVVQFSLRDQVAVVQEIREESAVARNSLVRVIDRIEAELNRFIKGRRTEIVLAGLVIFVGATVFLLLRIFKAATLKGGRLRGWLKILASFLRRPRTQESAAFYGRFMKIMRTRGMTRPPSLTPREFSVQIGDRNSTIAQPVLRITELFHAVRYDHQPLSEADLREIEAILKELSEPEPAATASAKR